MNQPQVDAARNNRPRMVFFQAQYGTDLPKFLVTHSIEHVECLRLFFDLTVINRDCDYEEICDKYNPDVTLFESGVNHKACRRPKIRNTRHYPQVFKVVLHHGDGFCNARAGLLSDMEEWGIDACFSIATTAAEHLPEIASSLLCWPVFIDPTIHRDYSLPKVVPVLLTGNRNNLYPWRRAVFERVLKEFPCLLCPHPGYENRGSSSYELVGERYARTINASFFVPACGTIAKEVIRKHLEVPGNRSCLIAETSPALRAAGFTDMVNCVFADEHDVVEKIIYLLNRPDTLNSLIEAGHSLVHARHTSAQRGQFLQWFQLRRNLKPGERIVQANPFGPLSLATTKSDKPLHIVSGAEHLRLLGLGDTAFVRGDWRKARQHYLVCAQHVPWMPEVKLRIAICNLFNGTPGEAVRILEDLIQFLLCTYKAKHPDPVEWAYFMIATLCLGEVERAVQLAQEYSWLSHEELDRARWVVFTLSRVSYVKGGESEGGASPRRSIHQLPARSQARWIEDIVEMLNAGGALSLAELLKQEAQQTVEFVIVGSITRPHTRTKYRLAVRSTIQDIRQSLMRCAKRGIRWTEGVLRHKIISRRMRSGSGFDLDDFDATGPTSSVKTSMDEPRPMSQGSRSQRGLS
jgi:hypothetical protein